MTAFRRKPVTRNNNASAQNKSDMWLNLSIVKQKMVKKPTSKTPAVYEDVLDADGNPVVINIQKGIGLSADSKLGRSFLEALDKDSDRAFKLIGHVHVVTEESETETYEL